MVRFRGLVDRVSRGAIIVADLATEVEPLTGETPGLSRGLHVPVWQILERTRAETYAVITVIDRVQQDLREHAGELAALVALPGGCVALV